MEVSLKFLLPLLLWVVLGSPCLAQVQFDPYSEGPYSTVRLNINSTLFPGLPTNLDVWGPVESGTFPVLYFLDSFGAITPGAYYELFLDRIASHGIVVALPWKITSGLLPADKVPAVQQVLDWCSVNLDALLVAGGSEAGVTVDNDRIFALAHSAGSHIWCDYLRQGCGSVKGLVLMSPVDGIDPWGIQDTFCTVEGETLNYALPSLVMPAGLDAVSGGLLGVSCAPYDMSNRRFYDALDPASPRWFINATEFGHVDFMDPLFQEIVALTHFCAVNEDAGLLAFSEYRNYLAGQVVSFLRGVTEDDCQSFLQYLQEPDLMTVAVSLENEVPVEACPRASCSWWPQQ